ncbi:uncharacterized protein HGUI_02110 [Hanseniaspora guilliermondii]|uniref:Serine aminopeptidase S33 domain-containing protein n=1 Tax=Hanseniaspora guilliermondii TaxID=56406 RepID=A0A1L0FJZ0_9ASCO|nr:uncharacterized protein HGUI_02110 [Hanseniaspora guilliermondii]
MSRSNSQAVESDSDSSNSLNSRYASPLLSISPNEVLEYDEKHADSFNSTLDEKITKIKTNDERHQEFIRSIPFQKRRSSITATIKKKKNVEITNIVEDFKQDLIEYKPNDDPVEKELSDCQHSIFIKHKHYHKQNGISAILSRPDESKSINLQKGILLLHGHCGHKNYINLPIIDDLLHKKGYYILRVDFRGLGNSEENKTPEEGRTLQQDVEDIETCYLFFRDIVNIKLDTIIAHSRAVVSMFEFHVHCLQRKYMDFVPNLINCSGRFDGIGLKHKIMKNFPNWEKDKGYYTNTFRYGKLQKIFIPIRESMSVIEVDTKERFKTLDQRCSVLSIYGCKEQVMPLSAATKFDILFQSRHKLILIDDADHNFFGVIDNDRNPLNLPLKRGKINYNFLVGKHIEKYVSLDQKVSRFAVFNNTTNCTRIKYYNEEDAVRGRQNKVLTYPRWPGPFAISNIKNLRDFGGYTTLNEKLDTKGGVFFKSASLRDISLEGVLILKNVLRLDKIYVFIEENDECELLPENYEAIFTPISIDFLKIDSVDEVEEKTYDTLTNRYYDIFLNMKDSLRRVFNYLLLQKRRTLVGEESSVLFVSKNGHWKTSLISMMLLKLLGVDEYTICMEHCLTGWIFKNSDQKRFEMNDFLLMMKINERIDKDFGSIEDYAMNELGLSMKEIMLFRSKFLI